MMLKLNEKITIVILCLNHTSVLAMCSCCAQIQCHLRREDSQGVEGAEASQSYQQSQRIKGKTHAQFA